MTQLLEKALTEISKLPPAEQDALASERRWVASFEKSQDVLATLAEEALTEHRADRTKPL